MAIYTTDELYHHGVLGMKWGVRRYQNKDGTYTRAGVERYKKHLSEYNDARKAYKSNKTSDNRINMNKSKQRLEESYDRLKIDRRADKGANLYSKGHLITSNEDSSARARKVQMTAIAGAPILFKVLTHFTDTKTSAISAAAVAAGASAINWGVWAKTAVENKNMRAYRSRRHEEIHSKKKS